MKSDFGFWILNFGLVHESPRTLAKGCAQRLLNPKSKNPNPKSLPAFTLIEVLIAIALIVALVGTMYGFLFDVLSSRASIIEQVRQETAASTLIKQLDGDLMTCVVGDAAFGSGISGDATRLRILSRAVAANLATRGVDDPDVFADLQVAEYRFAPAHRRIEGRRGPATPGSGSPAPFTPIEGEIFKLRFRYHDGETWLASFDSLAQDRLPAAIEVAMWYRPLPEDAESELTPVTEEPQENETSDEIERTPSEEEEGGEPSTPPDRIRVFTIPDGRATATETPETSFEGESP